MTDDEIVDANNAADELAFENERLDVIALMSEAFGRRILWSMLCDCSVFGSTFNTESSVMAYKEGRRSVGLRVMGMIDTHCPHLYDVMRAENIKKEGK